MNKSFSAGIAAGIMLLGSVPAVADIKMGIFPRRPAAATHKLFKPLAEHLSKELGEKVELIIAKDFPTFWKGVESKQYDLVHFNQYHYIKSHKEYGYNVVVANEEGGSKQIAGALTVRKDSGINSVEDLKGKTILFGGGEKAMGSYIAPTAILKKAGLEADKDYTVKFAKNPPSAVIGTANKAADASGSGNVILKIPAVSKKIDVSQMKVLAESESFTHLPWAVKGDMADDKAEKIKQVMSTLKQSDNGKAVLKAAKVTDFYVVTDADYAKVKEITYFVNGEQY